MTIAHKVAINWPEHQAKRLYLYGVLAAVVACLQIPFIFRKFALDRQLFI